MHLKCYCSWPLNNGVWVLTLHEVLYNLQAALCIHSSSVSEIPVCIHGFNQAGWCSTVVFIYYWKKSTYKWACTSNSCCTRSTVVINHPWENWENSYSCYFLCLWFQRGTIRKAASVEWDSGREGWGQRAIVFHCKSCRIIWLFKLCTGIPLININITLK